MRGFAEKLLLSGEIGFFAEFQNFPSAHIQLQRIHKI